MVAPAMTLLSSASPGSPSGGTRLRRACTRIERRRAGTYKVGGHNYPGHRAVAGSICPPSDSAPVGLRLVTPLMPPSGRYRGLMPRHSTRGRGAAATTPQLDVGGRRPVVSSRRRSLYFGVGAHFLGRGRDGA